MKSDDLKEKEKERKRVVIGKDRGGTGSVEGVCRRSLLPAAAAAAATVNFSLCTNVCLSCLIPSLPHNLPFSPFQSFHLSPQF